MLARTCYRVSCSVAFLTVTSLCCGQSVVTPRVKLKVETALIDQSYCRSPDGEVGYVEFKLNVTIHNEGARSVLLCKKYVELDCPTVDHVKPDGTVGDAAFELNCDAVHASHNPTNLQRDYVIVKPGANFSFEGGSEAWFHLASSHANPKGLLTSGTYWLYPFVSTWGGTPEAAQVLRSRWRNKGDLISDELNAEPVLVTVKIPESPSQCK